MTFAKGFDPRRSRGVHKAECRCVIHGGPRGKPERWPVEKLLATKRRLNGQRLKSRIVEAGLKKDACETCGIGPKWNGERLTLPIHHRDGDKANNELDNLLIQCPNCHSQTDTFAGRNQKRSKIGK